MIDFAALKAPFPPAKVSWRIGRISKDGRKASALAYIDARDVMQRLDEVCGPENWQDDYPHLGSTTVCRIGLLVIPISEPNHSRNGEWIWKSDGAGTTDVEAEKGQLSDAFKRCAVKWGIGRYLYDMPAPWVEIDEFKHIRESELERLASMLPNAEPGVKVNALSGISKDEAKFWSRPKLTIGLTNALTAEAAKNHGKWTPGINDWWVEKFRAGINKAPSRDLLAKYQLDNQHILDSFDATLTHELCEACSIRAEQFSAQGV